MKIFPIASLHHRTLEAMTTTENKKKTCRLNNEFSSKKISRFLFPFAILSSLMLGHASIAIFNRIQYHSRQLKRWNWKFKSLQIGHFAIFHYWIVRIETINSLINFCSFPIRTKLLFMLYIAMRIVFLMSIKVFVS